MNNLTFSVAAIIEDFKILPQNIPGINLIPWVKNINVLDITREY